jgi:hypothetical protein
LFAEGVKYLGNILESNKPQFERQHMIPLTHPKHGKVFVSAEQWNGANDDWNEANAKARGFKVDPAKAKKESKAEVAEQTPPVDPLLES